MARPPPISLSPPPPAGGPSAAPAGAAPEPGTSRPPEPETPLADGAVHIRTERKSSFTTSLGDAAADALLSIPSGTARGQSLSSLLVQASVEEERHLEVEESRRATFAAGDKSARQQARRNSAQVGFGNGVA